MSTEQQAATVQLRGKCLWRLVTFKANESKHSYQCSYYSTLKNTLKVIKYFNSVTQAEAEKSRCAHHR